VDLDAPRVVLGGVAPVPLRVPRAEAVAAGGGAPAEVGEAAAEAIDVRDEPGVSAHYRRALTRTLVARACEEAAVR
jgi:CO/xanthine dehydrogenase FAD-binding subunit